METKSSMLKSTAANLRKSFLDLACVQTPRSPQKKRRERSDFFSEGRGTSVHRLRETFVHAFILICFPCACSFYLTLLQVVSFKFLFLFLKLRDGVGFSIPLPAPSSLGGGHAYDTFCKNTRFML